MSISAGAGVRLEIGHVLFIDLVGYSKLLLDEQREQLQRLTEIVRNTEQVRAAETADKLLRLPAGDGMALVFFSSPEAPVQCAIEIGKKLEQYPELKLRMQVTFCYPSASPKTWHTRGGGVLTCMIWANAP